jgi:hypothetical protein
MSVTGTNVPEGAAKPSATHNPLVAWQFARDAVLSRPREAKPHQAGCDPDEWCTCGATADPLYEAVIEQICWMIEQQHAEEAAAKADFEAEVKRRVEEIREKRKTESRIIQP